MVGKKETCTKNKTVERCTHIKPVEDDRMEVEIKTDIDIRIKTYFRNSTAEWVCQIEYKLSDPDVGGIARYTGKTEEEARNCGLACLPHRILEEYWE